MNPRLVAIAGPLRGVVFQLTEAEVSVGRDPSNQLSISDLSVSRRHCLIREEEGRFKLTDLESRNGSFVNGLPVKERQLEHGDQVKIGDYYFLFLLHEDEPAPAPSPVRLDEGGALAGTTIILPKEDLLSDRPERLLSALPPAARLTRALDALIKISATINSIRSLDELQRRLLELICSAVPAERGAILLGQDGLDAASVFGWSQGPGAEQPVSVSRTVAQQVLEEGVAILSNDVSEDKALSVAPSLATLRVQSLLAVPLLVFGKVIGVIYLDTQDPAARFDADHLQLMTAIAGVAAVALENARHLEWLEGEARRLRVEVNLAHDMIGEGPRMREVYQFIAKAAPTDSTVLVRGESGTGKELVARAIHRNSPRAAKPFVAINCAALTETLLESELFGHEKGAFTGAVAQKKGQLEVADGGTVFLDEMGELAPPLQAKLLRVLQDREVKRVGGTRPIKVDIRLVAATNRDLEAAIKAGAFRQDLYYRLNVVSLTMPPLRERREDVALLASYFAQQCGRKCKRQVRGISPEARALLAGYDWPGNVRELENAIERAVVLGSTDVIQAEDLPETILEAGAATQVRLTKYYETIKEVKTQLILKALEQAQGGHAEAARLLGMHPNNLHRLLRSLGLKPAGRQ